MARYENKRRNTISKVITLIISVILLMIGFDYIYPVKHSHRDVEYYLENNYSLNDVKIENHRIIEGNFASGVFYIFTYKDNEKALGKISFTKLFGNMKPVEVHLNSSIEEVNTLNVSGQHYRVISSGPIGENKKNMIVKDGSIHKEFRVMEEYPIWTYPIESSDFNNRIQIEFK